MAPVEDPKAPDDLEDRLSLLPRQPGVYYLKGPNQKVLYVGKAKNLANRVRNYFRGDPLDPRIARLREQIEDFDYVVTPTEAEAMILEATLVKEYQPVFNIQLRDDKSYPYIKITTAHAFPGVFVTRNIKRDGSKYFGPFTKVKALRATIKQLRALFPLRNCTDRRLSRDDRECLEYHVGKCVAPCTHRITREDYAEIVQRLIKVFEGRGQEVIRELKQQMDEAKNKWRYEEAARCRDLIQGVYEMGRRQAMVQLESWDADVIGLCHRGDKAVVVVLSERQGRVQDRTTRELRGVEDGQREEILEAFLGQFYGSRHLIPPRVVIPKDGPDPEALAPGLSQLAGHKVTVTRGRQGRWRQLVETAEENASLILEEKELLGAKRGGRVDPSVYELQEALRLRVTPYRIEGYDVSNVQGTHAVASRVLFVDGVPLKAGYRRYRIRTVKGPNDVAMLAEALDRRLERVRRGEEEAPDLILVDGGRGQVSRAREVLRSRDLSRIPVIGLAKRHEEVIGPAGLESRRLPPTSRALKLLQRIRDEAHRFAVSYHRRLRGSALKASSLDAVPGIGPKRKVSLLATFGSLERLRASTPEEIAQGSGVSLTIARRVHEALKEEAGGDSGDVS